MGGGEQAPAGRARPRVFLSYRRADTQHAAGRAADKLADRYDLFMDIDTIPPGVDFADYLRRAVGGCDVLLAFVGDRWADAVDEHGRRRLDDPQDWVAAEIATALSRGIPVIPVLVDAAALPMADILPASIRPMVGRQAAPLRFETFSADLSHLVAAIDHAAAGPAAAQAVDQDGVQRAFAERWAKEPAPRERTPVGLALPAGRRRTAPLVVGAAAVVLLGLGTWFWLSQPHTGASPAPTSSVSTGPPPAAATVPPATSVAALRERVPRAVRGTCRKLVPTDPGLTADLLVAIQCTPTAAAGGGPRPRFAFYLQYRNTAAAQAAFRGYYASGAPGQGDCTSGPGEVADERPGAGTGVLRCYRDANDYLVFAWTAQEQAIVASAADPDRSFGDMFSWWSSAGPSAP